jgi:preprotein translocase subunit SecA
MRDVERQVMLRIIDQRWREHLDEMDYLQDGINLRAMGQKDPLTEWQREGFEMFGSDDEGHRAGLRQVRDARAGGAQGGAGTRGAERAADLERRSHRQRLRCGQGRDVAWGALEPEAEQQVARAEAAAAAPVKQQTVVKDEWAKTPRNAPCPCGSGKKFKMCHGAPAGAQ